MSVLYSGGTLMKLGSVPGHCAVCPPLVGFLTSRISGIKTTMRGVYRVGTPAELGSAPGHHTGHHTCADYMRYDM